MILLFLRNNSLKVVDLFEIEKMEVKLRFIVFGRLKFIPSIEYEDVITFKIKILRILVQISQKVW